MACLKEVGFSWWVNLWVKEHQHEKRASTREQEMYRLALRRLALRLGMLMMLLALITACGAAGGGGGGEQADNPRPLPEGQQALRPGTYSTEEFKPSLSFQVGEGWETDIEVSDFLYLRRGEEAALSFWNAQEVYKPSPTGDIILVPAPDDMAGWFQRHPYLQTDEPEQVTVGGVTGAQFDVVVVAEDLPEDYQGACGTGCVDIARFSDGSWISFEEGYKERVVVLEDVKGQTVTIDFGSPATEFDEFAPEAQKVIDSVEWRDS